MFETLLSWVIGNIFLSVIATELVLGFGGQSLKNLKFKARLGGYAFTFSLFMIVVFVVKNVVIK